MCDAEGTKLCSVRYRQARDSRTKKHLMPPFGMTNLRPLLSFLPKHDTDAVSIVALATFVLHLLTHPIATFHHPLVAQPKRSRWFSFPLAGKHSSVRDM